MKRPIQRRWWFRLDEWSHRHLPAWAQRWVCWYADRRMQRGMDDPTIRSGFTGGHGTWWGDFKGDWRKK